MENRQRRTPTVVDILPLALAAVLSACQADGGSSATAAKPAAPAAVASSAPAPAAAAAPAAAPAPAPAQAPAPAKREARQEPLEGPPTATLVVSQAQFVDRTGPDGKTMPVPGAAKLTIVRNVGGQWKTTVLEDADSNVFHKAMPWDGGLLTIGGNQAMLKTWKFADGKWTQQTHWNPKFGGKFDRLRDVEHGDLNHDGTEELVIATHDQGVIAVVHPAESWRVEEIDRQASTFVHEIEIGDVDGDGKMEFFATPSKPNKLDQEQAGEVTMYKAKAGGGWDKSVVDAPGDTHAKEILAADVDKDGVSELYIVWEGAIAQGGTLVRPVVVKQYRMKDGKWTSAVVGEVPDRQMRAIQAGDVNGDGRIDLVAGGLGSGLWLFEQEPDGTWSKSQIDAQSSGFEQPVLLADLDGDGKLEIYVGSEDQGELRRYRFENGTFVKTVIAPLTKGDISWNVNDAKL